MRTLILTLFVIFANTPLAYADTQRPSIVKNVKASTVSNSAIRISWNRPWDNVKVAGYNIYRNSRYYSTVYNTTNFIDKGLKANTRYEYAIVAFDWAKNYSVLSSRSAALTSGSGNTASTPAAAPANNTRPGAPQNLRAESVLSNSIKLRWNKPSGNVTGYNLYRDGRYFKTIRGSTFYTAGSLQPNKQYRFVVVAFNGNRFSIKSRELQIKTAAVSSAGAATNTGSDSSAVPAGYRLVFSDEFRNRKLDTSKWNTRYRWGPWWTINREQQFYVDQNNEPNFGYSPFEFDGEHMTIKLSKTPNRLKSKSNNKPYLSGALTTYKKFNMRYGYVEMRAKLPKGKGLWPAFWLLHNHENGRRPEIDVVEMLGDKPTVVYQTYHYYDNRTLRSTPTYKAWGPDYSKNFHTYGMKWEPGRISWYVDGKLRNTYSSGNASSEDMYLLLNLAIGGAWAGSPNSSTPFPARFKIDYIRAYQKP